MWHAGFLVELDIGIGGEIDLGGSGLGAHTFCGFVNILPKGGVAGWGSLTASWLTKTSLQIPAYIYSRQICVFSGACVLLYFLV